MTAPRVARLDGVVTDDEPAPVLDLDAVVGGSPATGVAPVAPLGDVPGVPAATSVADLAGVGSARRSVPGSVPGSAPGVERSGPEHRTVPHLGGERRTADLDTVDTVSAVAPAAARLARLDGIRPGRTRGQGGPEGPPTARRRRSGDDDRAAPDRTDRTDRADRRRRDPADGPTPRNGPRPPGAPTSGAEQDSRPARPRRPPGPKQIDPDADPVAAAREICLRLLTDRARTRTELAQALARRGVPGDAAHTVLERFDEVGLIDDAAFAGQWVRSRHRGRGLARRAIAQELRRKGVDDETAGEALAEVDGESEARRARELVDRKLRTVPAGTPEQRATAARRLVGMLARKGYGAGVAYGVVKEALAELGADPDEVDGDEPFTD